MDFKKIFFFMDPDPTPDQFLSSVTFSYVFLKSFAQAHYLKS
jgi:hypothetical protein